MSDNNEDSTRNVPEFSVSELSFAVQKTVEGAFSRLRVRGEISGFKRAPSGHLYLTLKDADAVLAAVCWKYAAQRLTLRPEDGMEVIATGRLTTFSGQSRYQLIVDDLALAGRGALLALIEERKKKLAAEGLFALDRKRPLPALPSVIGIVTSPTGAVIRDILQRLAERCPRQTLLWPVLVQGEQAAKQIVAAIEGFNLLPLEGSVPRPDLLIVARGGGSVEDLMPFNEESVVRAAAASAIPLISAIGHETDTTLLDFVADRRAPTPSAAAEMAVPVRSDLLRLLQQMALRSLRATDQRIESHTLRLQALTRGLSDPARLLMQMTQRLDFACERLYRALERSIDHERNRLERFGALLPPPHIQLHLAAQRLDATHNRLTAAYRQQLDSRRTKFAQISGRLRHQSLQHRHDRANAALAAFARLLESYAHHRTLARGFALIRNPSGAPILSAGQVLAGDRLVVEFFDGQIAVKADRARDKTRRPSSSPQGNLL